MPETKEIFFMQNRKDLFMQEINRINLTEN